MDYQEIFYKHSWCPEDEPLKTLVIPQLFIYYMKDDFIPHKTTNQDS